MCGCSKKTSAVKALQSPAVEKSLMGALPNGVEAVTVTSPQRGIYTVDSGNKYKSYGVGTKWTIQSSDRPALEKLGLIAPKV